MPYAYFARSIRGDRREADDILYRGINQIIKACGWRPQFDYPITLDRTGLSTEQYIHHRDIAWLDQCQVMIAEVTTASHGVGYEIAYAKYVRKMPILPLYEKGVRVSAMLAGDLTILPYRDLTDAQSIIASFLAGYHAR